MFEPVSLWRRTDGVKICWRIFFPNPVLLGQRRMCRSLKINSYSVYFFSFKLPSAGAQEYNWSTLEMGEYGSQIELLDCCLTIGREVIDVALSGFLILFIKIYL